MFWTNVEEVDRRRNNLLAIRKTQQRWKNRCLMGKVIEWEEDDGKLERDDRREREREGEE